MHYPNITITMRRETSNEHKPLNNFTVLFSNHLHNLFTLKNDENFPFNNTHYKDLKFRYFTENGSHEQIR